MKQKTIILAGCGGAKLEGTHAAEDLYVGSLFVARRRYIEARGLPWWIVSARYGLLAPGQLVRSYDLRLCDLPTAERMAWPVGVVGQLIDHHAEEINAGALRVELHAGAEYAEPLAAVLKLCGIPHEFSGAHGLAIGKQLAWYAEARRYCDLIAAKAAATA